VGRRDRRARRRGGQRGFSVLELVVAMAVMLFALLLACDLLDESGRLLHHSMRRARDPLPLLASELLRNDLRAALPQREEDWTSGPLALEVPGEGLVVWHRRGEQLWRSSGAVGRPRVGRVEGWRWRALPRGAVEVHIELAASGTWLAHSRAGLPRRDAARPEVLRILVAGRGGQDGW
jgi:prepilin-type N-terminal cleavage/methylation domain-containing protein